MKVLSLILPTAVALSAQAQYIDVQPENSPCLEQSAEALLPLIVSTKDDRHFELVYGHEGLPEYVNSATGDAYVLEGVWSTRDNEEFIQYGDDSEVFTALVQLDQSGQCSITHIDTAKKF